MTAIKHHGFWYSIDATDVDTKLVFRVLTALMSVQLADDSDRDRARSGAHATVLPGRILVRSARWLSISCKALSLERSRKLAVYSSTIATQDRLAGRGYSVTPCSHEQRVIRRRAASDNVAHAENTRGVYVVAGAISRSMRFAFSISATRRSYAACKFSHERASPPK